MFYSLHVIICNQHHDTQAYPPPVSTTSVCLQPQHQTDQTVPPDRPNSTTSVCLQPQHQTDQTVSHQYVCSHSIRQTKQYHQTDQTVSHQYVCSHSIRQTKQYHISMSAAHQTDQTYLVKDWAEQSGSMLEPGTSSDVQISC